MNSGGGADGTPPGFRRRIVYTRTTATTADRSSLDAGINHIYDAVMPALERLDGYVGLSMLANRSSGRCVVTAAWESRQTLRASTDAVQKIRERAITILGGTDTALDRWEIEVLHREHEIVPGACARVTWFRVEPTKIDAGVDVFKHSTLPELEALDGMSSASLMVDRRYGREVSSAVYDNAEALRRNRRQLDRIASEATRRAGAEVVDEHEFEVIVARLRVPELI